MHAARAAGRNEMPFGRDTPEVPSNIVLDWAPGLRGKGRFVESEPPVRCDAAYLQSTLALVVGPIIGPITLALVKFE